MGEAQEIPEIDQSERIEKPLSSEGEQIKALVKIGARGPSIDFTWPRHNEYDFHHDRKLTPDELFLVPSSDGNSELQSIIEYSPNSDLQIAKVLLDLPISKIGRALSRVPTKPRSIMEIISRDSIERAAEIVICMRECSYENNQYASEGSRAARVLNQLPEELREDVLKQIEAISPQYSTNIRKQFEPHTSVIPKKEDFPWSTEPVDRSHTGDLPRYEEKVEGKKIFQGQFSTASANENLQTFGINDCVAVAMIDDDGNKALAHIDKGMDSATSLDHILFSFVKNGGDLAKTKVALVGGFDSSREMIWRIRERLKQAGLGLDVTRLIEGDSKQILITDQGFFDFNVQYVSEDRINMQAALERIRKEGNGRIAQLV